MPCSVPLCSLEPAGCSLPAPTVQRKVQGDATRSLGRCYHDLASGCLENSRGGTVPGQLWTMSVLVKAFICVQSFSLTSESCCYSILTSCTFWGKCSIGNVLKLGVSVCFCKGYSTSDRSLFPSHDGLALPQAFRKKLPSTSHRYHSANSKVFWGQI